MAGACVCVAPKLGLAGFGTGGARESALRFAGEALEGVGDSFFFEVFRVSQFSSSQR